MATVASGVHGHHGSVLGEVREFFVDLSEEVHPHAHQPEEPAKGDMFQNHLNGLAITYFAFIVVFLAVSIPFMIWLVKSL